MATKKKTDEQVESSVTADGGKKYDNTKWAVPSKRAKGYAAERRNKVHAHGKKQGKPLTEYEAGLRSGYLQCQNDHAGIFKFKKALSEGKTKQEAAKISRQKMKRA